jgi:PKD repeat protein
MEIFPNQTLLSSIALFFDTATQNSITQVYNSSNSDNFIVGTSSGKPKSGGGGSFNTPPNADAGGPYTGAVGQPITFNGGASTDVDGSITGYKWDFTNDGIYDTEWISTATTSHSYGTPGSYSIKLIVKDNEGATATATATVTITGAGKSPPIALTNGPYNGVTSRSIQFDGSKSYDPDGTIISYTWDFGDGSKAYTVSPEHLFPNEGEYTITLTITDNDDLTDEDTTIAIVLLDTDGDGWSDVLEVAYGTSETDPNDQPIDTDQDGIPDQDSPDGSYIGDSDDDNDGLSDEYEEFLGSNPKDASDVIEIQINGATYYLVDTDGNAEFDTLFDPFTEQSTSVTNKEGKLYLDSDNNGIFDYIYDPDTGELSVYSSQEEEFPFAIIIIFIIVLILIAIGVLFKTGYLYVENVPRQKRKK